MTDDLEEKQFERKLAGAGGTKGGVLEFLFGAGLVLVGGYLVMRRVTVSSGYWNWFGNGTFGITLIPLLLGIGLLFFNGKSVAGWILAGAGLLVVFAGIVANLNVYFQPTDLFSTLVIFGMMAAGLGLVARAVREH